jgi:hypothetical protein
MNIFIHRQKICGFIDINMCYSRHGFLYHEGVRGLILGIALRSSRCKSTFDEYPERFGMYCRLTKGTASAFILYEQLQNTVLADPELPAQFMILDGNSDLDTGKAIAVQTNGNTFITWPGPPLSYFVPQTNEQSPGLETRPLNVRVTWGLSSAGNGICNRSGRDRDNSFIISCQTV